MSLSIFDQRNSGEVPETYKLNENNAIFGPGRHWTTS